MFGYISLNTGALEPEAAERYRAHYCGLCKSLRERFGIKGRLTLSNDMTFLVLLLHSLYEPESQLGEERCPVHPIKVHAYSQSRVTDYAADMNLLLTYYKLRDNQKDDHDLLQGLGAEALKKQIGQIESRYPDKCRAIRDALDGISKLEAENSVDIDSLCNLSGRMLGEVFVYDPKDVWMPLLRRVGEGLGRFIYFMDAYEDYDADKRKKRFNPLISLHEQQDYEGFCLETLNLLIAEATEAFELLPLEENLDLMRRVLYGGVWMHYHRMHEKPAKEKTDG